MPAGRTCPLLLSPGASSHRSPCTEAPAADSECHLPLQDGQQRQHAQTNEICLFLETPGTSKPLPDRVAGSIILFFKLYEPTQRKLSFIGHFQVSYGHAGLDFIPGMWQFWSESCHTCHTDGVCLVSGFIVAWTGFTQVTKCIGSWLQGHIFVVWLLPFCSPSHCCSAISIHVPACCHRAWLAKSDCFTVLWKLDPAWPACLTPMFLLWQA